MKFRGPLGLSALVIVLLGSGLFPASASAHANLVRSEPVTGTAVPVAPAEIRLFFSEPPEPRYSEIKVFDESLQRFDTGPVSLIPGDSSGLQVGLRELPQGVYTVAWKSLSTVDGHTTEGSVVFSVGTAPPPPMIGVADTLQYTSPTVYETLFKWLMILGATTLVGALGLRVLVWTPVLRTVGQSESAPGRALDQQISRRLGRLVGATLVVLTLATIIGLIGKVAKVTNRSWLDVLGGAGVTDFLSTTREGSIWAVRLLLLIVAFFLLAPLIGQSFRRTGTPRDDHEEAGRTPTVPMLFGLVLGLGYLLTISLIGHAAASPLWPAFTIVMDWLHLTGVAVWVGGLIGLLLTLPLVRDLDRPLRPLLARVVARFSTIALTSIAVLTITGLYSAWIHIGSLDFLWPTEYGRSFLLKMALFGGLLALAACNLLWIKPRLARPHPATVAPIAATERRNRGNRGGARPGRATPTVTPPPDRTTLLLLRYFGRLVRGEVLLGVLVILTTAVMIGYAPARDAIVEVRAPKRMQTQTLGNLQLTLTLAALQPGDNSFDLYLAEARGGRPVSDAEKVTLRVSHLEMDMGVTEVVMQSQGNGHYTASGPFLSMSGVWDLQALVRRTSQADTLADFRLPIGATANLLQTPTKPTPPVLPRWNSTRGLGLLALAAGSICLVFGVRLFRRGAGTGTIVLMLVPTLLVVGGYLTYNGDPNDQAILQTAEPTNPIPADATSIANGTTLFAENCAVCHGPQGRGDGPQAATLNPRPVNFTLPHTAYHSDGYLFNSLTNGIPGSAMAAWGTTLNERERWDLVNYIRQFNPLTANGATPPSPQSLPISTPGTPPASLTPPAAGRASTATLPIAPTASPRPAGGTATPASTPASRPAMDGQGRLIHAFDGAIWATNPATGERTNLTPNLPQYAYASDPALSPDATTLAYIVIIVPPPPQAPNAPRPILPGSDIWLMDSNGGRQRLLQEHDHPGVVIDMPVWTPDGAALLYGYTIPVYAPDGRYTGSSRELQRLDVATGQRTTLVKDAGSPTVTASGGQARLGYIVTNPNVYEQSLWVADLDGRNAQRLVGPEAKFLTLSAPRFAPDGTVIVFAASGNAPGQAPPAPSGNVPLRFLRWLFAPLIPTTAAAHGPPGDLWTIASDGSGLRRLTQLNGDDPQPAWSPDGQRIAFLTGSGLYVINRDGSGLVRLTDRGGLSTLVWAPR